MADRIGSEPLSPEEEAALRKRAGLARCDWTYVAVDGRPYKCGLILRDHRNGLAGDHAFERRNSPTGIIAGLLATLDAAREPAGRDVLREAAFDLAAQAARAVIEPRHFHESTRDQHDLSLAVANLRAALAAQVPEPSLDAAWREAEAALPKGHVLAELRRFDNDDERWGASTDNVTEVERYHWSGEGPTPAAALQALASWLRATTEAPE